jgi:lysozyme
MNWKTVSLIALLFFGIGLITPQGRLIVMSYFEKLKSLVTSAEGLSLESYQDSTGHWTIGYGHLIKPGEVYYPYGSVSLITREQADLLFQADIADAENCIDTAVTVPLTDNQRAALVSFVFNTGCGAFKSSTLLKKINAQQFPEAAQEFDKWVYSTQPDGQKIMLAGLVTRRAQEKMVFQA